MRKFLLCTLAAGLAVLAGCRGAAIESQWKSQEILIDGDNAEWLASPPVLARPAVDVRVANNDSSLYLCLTTRDKRLARECLTMGLTVWFKPAGSQRSKLGIRFPIGIASGIRLPGGTAANSPEAAMQQALGEMEILGFSGEEARRFRVRDAAYYGIGVSFRPAGDSLVYELKVPLSGADAADFFAGSSADSLVRMTFETGEKELKGPQRPMRELDPEYGINSVDDMAVGYTGGRVSGASPYVELGTARRFSLPLSVKLAQRLPPGR